MTIKKFIGQVHLWLGLASGLVVFIVSITGCLYVFETEIQSLYNASYTRVAAQPGPVLPASVLAERGQRALAAELKAPVKPDYANVTFYRDPTKAAYYYAYHEKAKIYHYVHLNPYTGAVLQVRNLHRDPFTVIINLHTSLLLPHEVGHYVVGVAVLIFVISLLTGLVLWWPRSKAALKQRFTIKWNARWRRVNYDAHNVFGFYSLLPALLIAVTGLVWSFSWVDKGVYFLFSGSTDVPTYEDPISKRFGPAAPGIATPGNVLDRVTAQTVAQFPTAAYYSVNLPTADTSSIGVSAYPRETTYHDGTYLVFNQYTGQLLKKDAPETQRLGDRVRAMNYDIHIGKILGLPGQLLAFFASLVCASLPVTGLLIWLGRRRKACKTIGAVPATGATFRPRPTSVAAP